MRVWLACSLLLVLVAAPAGGASAQIMDGDVILEIHTPRDDDNAASDSASDYRLPNDTPDKVRNFNVARCVCSEDVDERNVNYYMRWMDMANPPSDRAGVPLEVWAGNSCLDEELRDEKCTRVAEVADAADLDDTESRIAEIGDLMTPGTDAVKCDPTLKTITVGVYTTNGSTLGKVTEAAVTLDMDPPPLPATVEVRAQENQISLEWDAIESEATDLDYFQALCARVDGSPAHDGPTDTIRYDTVESLCEGTQQPAMDELGIDNEDRFVGDEVTEAELPEDLRFLREAFICGETSGTASSISLGGLENGTAYVVVLVSVDPAGNPSAAFVPKTITPSPVTDFWEDVNDQNPELEGGLCLIEATFGAGGGGGGLYAALRGWRDDLMTTAAGRWMVARYYELGAPLAAAAQQSVVARVVLAIVLAPLIVVALVWHALGLPLMLVLIAGVIWLRRRRHAPRRGRRLQLALAGAAVVLAPSAAAAQSMTPYWDDLAVDDEVDEGPRYHLGIRVGPFLPSIDDAFEGEGPYQRTFIDGTWMPSLDVHRVWTTRFGQIGGGLSAGYFTKGANAWVPCEQIAGQPPCMPTIRAPGNTTGLRIVPLELTAIYRMSQLDDNWGIPLVPYARGGLAYSIWWVRRPDGELSKSCEVEGEQCDRGIGASAGLVGAVGLSIRAERVDGDAARSMRDSGLDHAGFYAEVSTSWVNGFGNEKKLSLGDTTWSAGVDFEF